MNYIYIIPGRASALIVDDVIEIEQATARKFCAENKAEYLEDNFFVTGNIHKVYAVSASAGQKAIDFLKRTTIEQLSAYVGTRMYNTFERARHKNLFDILTGYNAYRNGLYLNFSHKSMAELDAVLFNLYGIRVPKEYYFKGREFVTITDENALEFFTKPEKIK